MENETKESYDDGVEEETLVDNEEDEGYEGYEEPIEQEQRPPRRPIIPPINSEDIFDPSVLDFELTI